MQCGRQCHLDAAMRRGLCWRNDGLVTKSHARTRAAKLGMAGRWLSDNTYLVDTMLSGGVAKADPVCISSLPRLLSPTFRARRFDYYPSPRKKRCLVVHYDDNVQSLSMASLRRYSTSDKYMIQQSFLFRVSVICDHGLILELGLDCLCFVRWASGQQCP